MGVDLRDFVLGKISLRRLVIFTLGLERESLVIQELLHREHGDLTTWSPLEYTAADILDEMRISNYIGQCLMQRGAKNPTTPKKPTPAYRPKGKEKPKPKLNHEDYASEEEVDQFLNKFQPNMPILD